MNSVLQAPPLFLLPVIFAKLPTPLRPFSMGAWNPRPLSASRSVTFLRRMMSASAKHILLPELLRA
jgi:hypothetical protein